MPGYNGRRYSIKSNSMSQDSLTRRKLISAGLIGTVALPFLGKPAHATAEKLSPSDPQALKLGYVENVKQVDVKHFPTYKPGQTCANCNFIQLRYGPLRPCQIFPGKVVSEKGWCSAWVEKTYK